VLARQQEVDEYRVLQLRDHQVGQSILGVIDLGGQESQQAGLGRSELWIHPSGQSQGRIDGPIQQQRQALCQHRR
jgi:hypothetical protein